MELIMHYSYKASEQDDKAQEHSKAEKLLQDLKKLIPILTSQAYDRASSTLSLSFLVASRWIYEQVCKLQINALTGVLSIKLTLMQKNTIQCKSTYEKTLLLRTFLGMSKNCPCNWKLHPITGHLYYATAHLLPNPWSLPVKTLCDLVFCLINQGDLEMLETLQKVMYVAGIPYEQKGQFFDQEAQELFRLKTHIKVSNRYAWKIVEGVEKDINYKNRQNMKSYKKRCAQEEDLVKLVHKSTQESHHHYILKFMKPTEHIVKIQEPSRQQDDRIQEKFLKNIHGVVSGSRIINTIKREYLKGQINSRQVILQTAQTKKAVVNCGEQPIKSRPIKVRIQKFPQQKLKSLEYQRELLSTIKSSEHIHFAKYFYLEDVSLNEMPIRITNLADGTTLKKYFKKNKQTCSPLIKMSLLYGISTALLFLRDHDIVFHNLKPQRVFIRRGLQIKLHDLTNAYYNKKQNHFEWERRFRALYQRKLPYVNSIIHEMPVMPILTYDEERTDSFSLGMVGYEAFFGTSPYYLSSKCLSQMTESREQVITKRLESPPVMAPQKFSRDRSRLKSILGYLFLQSISCESLENTEAADRSGKSNSSLTERRRSPIQNRPYLDWLNIIIRESLNYCARVTNF